VDYSEKQQGATSSDRESSRYSVDLSKNFLPTLSLGFGWGGSELFVDSVLISQNFTSRLDGQAQIYPDLDMAFVIAAYESDNVQSSAKTSTRSGDLSLTSRMNPGLLLTLRGGYDETESELLDQAASSRGYSSSVTFNWRPADSLFFNGAVVYADNSSAQSQLSWQLAMDMILSELLLFEVDYLSAKAQEVSQTGKAVLTWSGRKGVRFENGCEYRHVTGQSEKNFLAFSRLAVNFAIP
jgi:hypothetical protein